MIYYMGVDDTDIVGSPGTNRIVKAFLAKLPESVRCERIIRHQLFFDPRVPYTSQNGSASLKFSLDEPTTVSLRDLTDLMREHLREHFVEGSDPGLCAAIDVPQEIVAYGLRCKEELMTQDEAFGLASSLKIHLEGLGGTNDGIIGALAAIGLAATNDDGRIVQVGHWPEDLAGPHPIETLAERGVEVELKTSGDSITKGQVDVGKKLRPNRSRGRDVLFVEKTEERNVYKALKLK
jgi:hypothetical protein